MTSETAHDVAVPQSLLADLERVGRITYFSTYGRGWAAYVEHEGLTIVFNGTPEVVTARWKGLLVMKHQIAVTGYGGSVKSAHAQLLALTQREKPMTRGNAILLELMRIGHVSEYRTEDLGNPEDTCGFDWNAVVRCGCIRLHFFRNSGLINVRFLDGESFTSSGATIAEACEKLLAASAAWEAKRQSSVRDSMARSSQTDPNQIPGDFVNALLVGAT